MIRQLMLTTILNHLVFSSCRFAVSLDAIHLGASPFIVGLLVTLFAVLPMLFSLSMGRLIDRIGMQRPMIIASSIMAAAAPIPFFIDGLSPLFAVSALVGSAFMVVHICMQNAAGLIGNAAERPQNFSLLALAFSTSGSLGPLMTGFAIDHIGYQNTFLALSVTPILSILLMGSGKIRLPATHAVPRGEAGKRKVAELFAYPELRTLFITSAIIATAWDMYMFVMPIYGRSIGLSASSIGLIIGAFSVATFAIRLSLPLLSRRIASWKVLSIAMVVGGSSFFLFPLVHSAALLMLLSFILGLGMGSAQPMVMSLVYNASPPGRAAEAVGVRSTLMHGSQTFIPLLFGAMGSALGVTPVFLVVAVSLTTGAWLQQRGSRR